MTDQGVSNSDRNSATAIVEAAFKAGQIVRVDRDLRISQIKGASSKYEIETIVRGLGGAAAPTAVPTSTQAQPGQPGQPDQSWPQVNYGPHADHPDIANVAAAAAGAGRRIGGIVAVIFVAAFIVPIVGVAIGLLSARDSFTAPEFAQPVDETTYLPGQAPGVNGVNVFTDSGFADLVTALEEQTGSTRVFNAVIYPRYAVLSVPEGPRGKRYTSWYWNGRDLNQQSSKSTSTDPRVDLRSVNSEVLIALVEDVRDRVEKPESWYAIVESLTNQGPRMMAYANNEYGETSYVIANLQGEITYESDGR